MRKEYPELFRVRAGVMASPAFASYGCFLLERRGKVPLKVIVNDGTGWEDSNLPLPVWEHVSVSTEFRVPTWEEMCYVKGLFWNDEDLVIQFHPPQSKYINHNSNVLHMWRPLGLDIPLPPSQLV